ncbi:hypothetical protein ACPA9J_02380 [Pseudomonas aeruginosa]
MESLQKWVVDLNGVVRGAVDAGADSRHGLYLMLGVEVHAPGAPGSRLSACSGRGVARMTKSVAGENQPVPGADDLPGGPPSVPAASGRGGHGDLPPAARARCSGCGAPR